MLEGGRNTVTRLRVYHVELVSVLLPIQITAGFIAIVLGFTALAASKGGVTHRRVGELFVYALLVMGFSASLLGLRKSWTDSNVFAGLMCAYFVLTGLTA